MGLDGDVPGDGMAVVAPTWMNFDFTQRVPVGPPMGDMFPLERFTSNYHSHTPQSPCLQPVTGGVFAGAGGETELPEPGWFICTQQEGYRVHDHGGRMMAHMARDRRACPDGAG